MSARDSRGAWFGVSCTAFALMGAMLLVMWTQRPSSECILLEEVPQRLVLDRETDREHLASDLAWVDRIARRYAATMPNDDQRHIRFSDCEARLVQQIGTRHALSPQQLRAEGGLID